MYTCYPLKQVYIPNRGIRRKRRNQGILNHKNKGKLIDLAMQRNTLTERHSI
jgi:hypothetical protein